MCIYLHYSHVRYNKKGAKGCGLGLSESVSLMDYPIVYDVACNMDQVP